MERRRRGGAREGLSQRRKRLLDVGGRPFELARIGIFLIIANRRKEGNEVIRSWLSMYVYVF